MSESKERDGVFGKYTEHFDDDGNKVGESRERDGIFGKYTEHTDVHGDKIGESRERDGVFGKYTEHSNDDGNKVGESKERDGVFGKYTEHTDVHGDKIGESRERDGVFGKYTEHTGSGYKGTRSRSDDAVQSRVESEGLLDILGDAVAKYATPVGGIIGLIAGGGLSIDQSFGFGGFVISTIVGGAVGAILANLMVWGLILGVAVSILMLLLKACGVGI